MSEARRQAEESAVQTLTETHKSRLAERLKALDDFDVQTRAMLAERGDWPMGTFPGRAAERDLLATRALESARFLLAMLP